MATVTTERQRIVDILKAWISENSLPPKWTAHRYLPRQLNHAGLPAFTVLPQVGARSRVNTNARKVATIYRIRLYVAPVSDGTANQIEAEVEGYIDSLADYLDAHLRLGLPGTDVGLNGVLDSETTSSGGLFAAPYPDGDPAATQYFATEWFLRVTSTRRLTNPS